METLLKSDTRDAAAAIVPGARLQTRPAARYDTRVHGDPNALEALLYNMMLKHGGVGLAAPQIGVDAAVFVIRAASPDDPERPLSIFNPRIVEKGPPVIMEEGCLSFPGVFVAVSRPAWILARFADVHQKYRTARFEGMTARIFLHEFDHLRGVTFKERVSKLRWNMAVKKAKKSTL